MKYPSGVFLIILVFLLSASHGLKSEVEVMYYWKQVFFENLPLDDGAFIGKHPYYIPENNDVTGLAHHAQSGLMIISIPRIRPGVPSTLNAFCLSDHAKGTSPWLWGFPNYKKNTLKASFYGERDYDDYDDYDPRHLKNIPITYSAGYYEYFFNVLHKDSDARTYPTKPPFYPVSYDFKIISVYSPVLDNDCNRLYVLDTGTIQYTSVGTYNVQNPAIVVFDIPSDGCKTRQFEVLRRLEIPNHLWKNPMGFIHLTIDQQVKGTCDDVFIYCPNIFESSLIVCDYKRGSFWSFKDSSFQPVYSESNLVFRDNYQYSMPGGITNLVLGYPDKDGHKNAYYAPSSSFGQYAVFTKVIKDVRRSYKKNVGDFHLIGYRGCNSQTNYQVIDLATGVIFFAEMQSHRIRCWNIQHPINSDSVGVIFESNKLDFVSDLNLDSDGNLLFISNQNPITYLTNKPLNVSEVNSRIFRVKASEAIRGTVCDTSHTMFV
ncbi:Six-bladed beta-propeller, TolB-like [Sergentomyia squamirostris]